MKFFRPFPCLVPALALLAAAPVFALESTNVAAPATAREFYNAGTRLLAARDYPAAEKMFQAALAAQDYGVDPLALYNVGNTRFDAGLDRLKKGPDAQKLEVAGSAVLANADAAIRQSQAALANGKMDDMVAAYLEGRGTRHQLREAEKAVSAAMETYGKTLEQWRRSADDFKGAHELSPADTNAQRNAEIVDRGIAKLVDTVRKMQAMKGMMGQKRQELGKQLGKLKGQIPAQDAPPGAAGDDDEDEQGMKPDALAGHKEGAGRPGEQMQFVPTPEQAGQILSGLSLDGTRRLDLSDKEGKPRQNRTGRNW